jgi:glycosyltransferase involved in cell wall biosynthesis
VTDRLRILVLSPYVPSRSSGGPVRLHGLVMGLPEWCDVTVLAFESGIQERDLATRAVRERCREIVTIRNDLFALPQAAKRALQLRSVLSTRSFDRITHERAPFQAALESVLERSPFDIVQIEHSYMAHYAIPPGPAIVLDAHNVEYEVRARSAAVTAAGPRKLYDAVNWRKLRREEERSWRTAAACAVTSARDEATIRKAAPAALTAVVPNAVDTSHFSPGPAQADPLSILFFGTMAYYPNVDAVLFFLREVMPLLRKSHPSVRLRIVGSLPPRAVTGLAGPDVTITGYVEDVRPYLERANVVVAPLRIGGGTRLKILEAMAMARPVVSTSLGAEGLAATHGQEILIADSPEQFAAQVGRVLDDVDLTARLGLAARRLVEERYDWKASARRLETLYWDALDARRPKNATKTRAITAA